MRRGTAMAEYWAEFVGTALLIIMGDGVVANVIFAPRLSGFGQFSPVAAAGQAAAGGAGYDWNTITWGWAMAVALAVYVAGGITGAHINPAVTLAAVVRRSFPITKAIGYWIAQVVGAFVGALIVYIAYLGSFMKVGFTNVFYTGPGQGYDTILWQNILVEILGTFVLVLFIYAIVDNVNNVGPGANLWPFMVGLAVLGIGLSLGGPTGYAINPARDFGPRLFSLLVGDSKGFSGLYWLLVPIVGPLIGGPLGAWFYDIAITPMLPVKK